MFNLLSLSSLRFVKVCSTRSANPMTRSHDYPTTMHLPSEVESAPCVWGRRIRQCRMPPAACRVLMFLSLAYNVKRGTQPGPQPGRRLLTPLVRSPTPHLAQRPIGPPSRTSPTRRTNLAAVDKRGHKRFASPLCTRHPVKIENVCTDAYEEVAIEVYVPLE